MGHQETMGHRHQWQSEPPQGKLSLGKSWDKIYGDEEDMAANAMYNSHEEIQQLRNLLLKDLDFETSSNWPQLIEWCSTCTETRIVKLILPEEDTATSEAEDEVVMDVKEEVYSDQKFHDACTQTPRPKQRREADVEAGREGCLYFK